MPARQDDLVKPFRIDVPEDVLDDLRSRLARTRYIAHEIYRAIHQPSPTSGSTGDID